MTIRSEAALETGSQALIYDLCPLFREASLQESVALKQRLIITNQRIKILTVELRNHYVHKTAALFTST